MRATKSLLGAALLLIGLTVYLSRLPGCTELHGAPTSKPAHVLSDNAREAIGGAQAVGVALQSTAIPVLHEIGLALASLAGAILAYDARRRAGVASCKADELLKRMQAGDGVAGLPPPG